MICPYGWKWDHENAECVPGPYAVTAECPPGYEFSVSQKRCVQKRGQTEVKCWPGTKMNPATGKCEPVAPNVVATPSAAATSNQQVGPVSVCPPGKVWNPITNRCGDPESVARMRDLSGSTIDLWGGVAQVREQPLPRYANTPKPPSTTTALVVGGLAGILVGYALWNTRAVAR